MLTWKIPCLDESRGERRAAQADLPEHLCWHNMHFVHEQQAPFPAANLVHHPGAFLAALATERNHGVGGDCHPTHPSQPLLLIRCEPACQSFHFIVRNNALDRVWYEPCWLPQKFVCELAPNTSKLYQQTYQQTSTGRVMGLGKTYGQRLVQLGTRCIVLGTGA